MLDWYNDMENEGTLSKNRYFDPWTDMTDEEMLFFFENDEDVKEDQKAKLGMYIDQWKHNKKIIEKHNKYLLKTLGKFGLSKKEDVRFLSENTYIGKEALTEEEKEFWTTYHENETEIDPVLKTWFDNDSKLVEIKKNMKKAKTRLKSISKF